MPYLADSEDGGEGRVEDYAERGGEAQHEEHP